MNNSPRDPASPQTAPLSPSQQARSVAYHSVPLPQSPSQATFPLQTATDSVSNTTTSASSTGPWTPVVTSLGTGIGTNTSAGTYHNDNTFLPADLHRSTLPQQPASPKPSRSSTGALPVSSPSGALKLHRVASTGSTGNTGSTFLHRAGLETTSSTRCATPDRAPVQFNTTEIERSFQALLKKQPVATPGPSLLQSKGNRQSPKETKLHHFLSPSTHSHLSVRQQRSPGTSGSRSVKLSGALSHSPVFGSPASEHAKHWIKSVGRDQLSDSESELRESDLDSYEDSQQQQWQIDYEHEIAGQLELEPEAVAESQAARAQLDLQASLWAGKVHPLFNTADSLRSGEQGPHQDRPSVRIKEQHTIHPLSPAPPSPSSGISTPRIPQSRSPEIRPQVVLHPAITSSAVNQPLPPLPAPPSIALEKLKARQRHVKPLEPSKKASKSNLHALKATASTGRNPVSLSNPPRRCIHHGKILQVINTSTVKDRYLFLFSDILLIAKHMSEGHPTLDSRFQVKDVIELKKISLSLSRDKYDPKNGEAGVLGNRKIPPILAEFIHAFDQNPTRALNTFIQKRALHPDPVSVAHLLFKTPELSKTQLASFLSNPANKHVYRAFLDQCQFAGVSLDEALRTLLGRLNLPERATARRPGGTSERTVNGVDYLLEEFTKRWYEANVNVVVFDASIAYKLVIAMIVLNAQLHSNEGANLVKDREEVGILVRPRVSSQPSTPTISSIPMMESGLTVPSTSAAQHYMTMELDDLTVFPTPSKESFVEMFQLLDQQRIVPKDTLHNIFLSINHQPLDIDLEKLDNHSVNTDFSPAVARKLWPIMVSPAVLPPRLTLKIPSDPITITVPVLNPHFSIHLGGRDLRCDPPVLEFGSHRSQRFRITGSVPGKKTLTITPRLVAEKGTPEQYYDLQSLPSKHSLAIERQFMRHTFQISLLNDLGTRRRYLFGTSTGAEKDEWASVLTDCLLVAKGQNAVRLNEHTGLEQSIGLQILKELLLGVEASDEDEVVPSQSNGQPEQAVLPIAVVPPPVMGLGIPMEGHGLPLTSPRSLVNPSATTVVGATGHQSPTLGGGATAEWLGAHNPGSTSPKEKWMCRMPKPGSVVPDRHGWELVRLVEQNSLMALMLGFMGALGRDRLRRIEALRKAMEEEEEEEGEEARQVQSEEELGQEYGVDEDRNEEQSEGGSEGSEQEYEEDYEAHNRAAEDEPLDGQQGINGQAKQELGSSAAHAARASDGKADLMTPGAMRSTAFLDRADDFEDAVVSAVSGLVRKVKGKEIWWSQQ